MSSIKQYLRQNFWVNTYLKKKHVNAWIKTDFRVPVPHEIKQMTIQYYAMVNRLDTLIETGTYLGDMVWAQKNNFKKIYSIELSEALHRKAEKRFSNDNHIQIIQGDSSEQIGKVVSTLKGPALFWLDGHYSGGITAKGEKGCPIYAELAHVFGSPFNHVILVDDARLFTGADDYPTMDELRQFIAGNSRYQVRIENDIIVLTRS